MRPAAVTNWQLSAPLIILRHRSLREFDDHTTSRLSEDRAPTDGQTPPTLHYICGYDGINQRSRSQGASELRRRAAGERGRDRCWRRQPRWSVQPTQAGRRGRFSEQRHDDQRCSPCIPTSRARWRRLYRRCCRGAPTTNEQGPTRPPAAAAASPTATVVEY